MEVMHFNTQKERLDYLKGNFEEIQPKEVKFSVDMEKECGDCPAWDGTDCTRLPYTEGCLKDEPIEEEKPKKEKKGKKKDDKVQA